jgi:hypothetical protein
MKRALHLASALAVFVVTAFFGFGVGSLYMQGHLQLPPFVYFMSGSLFVVLFIFSLLGAYFLIRKPK